MMPAQKQPKTKKRRREKTKEEREVTEQALMQKEKPMLPVDEMEFDKGLKPSSEFYRKSERISSDGGDDDDDKKDGEGE